MNKEIFEKYGDNPIALCNQWYEDAKKTEPNDPDAICLATADKNGAPSNRMVLVKDISDKGFKFHTNSTSHKGQDLEHNPKASICWYWKTTRKQIRIEGRVEKISQDESDTYFKTRPKNRQIGAWASDQSNTFEKWQDLENRIAEFKEKFEDVNDIPRPEYWNGYRLIPNRIEFWIAHRDRLHTRFVYTKNDSDNWTANWLYP